MSKLSVLLLIAFLYVESLGAQDYKRFYYEVYQANIVSKQGNHSEALSMYEAAFEWMDFVPTVLLKKFRKVAKKAGNTTLEKKYKSLIDNQKDCPPEYAHVCAKLDSLVHEDQRVRTKKSRLIRYYWKNVDNESVMNSPKFLKAKKARMDWKRTDSLNILILLDMFEEYGYLHEGKVGYESNNKVEIMLLHFDKDTSNVLLQPILDKALANGQITPQWYTITLDRHLYACELPQKYYGWPMLKSDPKLSEEEINEINKLRESIGIYGSDIKIMETRGHWRVDYISSTSK